LSGLDKYELLAELGRRRGFFWPAYEIYGGVGGFLDLGPLGAQLKRRIEQKWLDVFVRRHGLVLIQTPVITPAKVFEASGHLAHFKDPMVTCENCKRRFRADHAIRESFIGAEKLPLESYSLTELENLIREKFIMCPECGGRLSKPEYFTTMFQTTIGPYSEAVGYARPEAAQGMFADFRRVYETTRERLPLGIAQIGPVLRNEISPRQGPIRLREFTIMEFEFFFDPEEPECDLLPQVEQELLPLVTISMREKGQEEPVDVSVKEAVRSRQVLAEWSAYFMAVSKSFVTSLGIPPDKQRFHEKLKSERAHYSAQTFDHEVWLDRWGWVELAGHANRTDFDLKAHEKASGTEMAIFKASPEATSKQVRRVYPIQAKIGPAFKDKAPLVIQALSNAEPEMLERKAKTAREVEVGGFAVPVDFFEVREETIKETGRKFIPHVIEPSYGAERLVYATLEYAYTRREDRVVLALPFALATIQAGVFPLQTKDGLPEQATKLYRRLIDLGFDAWYDEAGTIGRRYARADEVGIPVSITIDYQTLQDESVTFRDRNSWVQVRVSRENVENGLRDYLTGKIAFERLGPTVQTVQD
jgi:glycyl-tRNA synthetase